MNITSLPDLLTALAIVQRPAAPLASASPRRVAAHAKLMPLLQAATVAQLQARIAAVKEGRPDPLEEIVRRPAM